MTPQAAEAIGDAYEAAAAELVEERKEKKGRALMAREFFTALEAGYELPRAPWGDGGVDQ